MHGKKRRANESTVCVKVITKRASERNEQKNELLIEGKPDSWITVKALVVLGHKSFQLSLNNKLPVDSH